MEHTIALTELGCGSHLFHLVKGSDLETQFSSQGNICNADIFDRLLFRSEDEARESIKYIRDCTFIPDSEDGASIFIGRFTAQDRVNATYGLDGGDGVNVPLPSGLFRSTFSGRCILLDSCRVSDTTLVRSVVVHTSAVISNCGIVAHSTINAATNDEANRPVAAFGYGTNMHVGAENGGRELCLQENWSFVDYCRVALRVMHAPASSSSSSDLVCGELWEMEREQARQQKSFFSIVGSGSVLHGCLSVLNSNVLGACSLRGCTISNCTIGASAGADTGADTGTGIDIHMEGNTHIGIGVTIQNSIISTNCSIHSNASVHSSYLDEHVHISESALVISSILGPDSSISRGECHHCLLGPFVGFHHTSLLISALWPGGRGNMGYGCMLGSNHTGKVNDQEFFPGEGMFFGLNVSVKFPCNLYGSPYSLIASDTSVPSMRLALPFSLLSSSSSSAATGDSNGNGSASCINIRPGWVLYSNPYMLVRAAMKFQTRRKAQHTTTDYDIFRPSSIDMVRAAIAHLEYINTGTSGDSSGKAIAAGVGSGTGYALQNVDVGLAAYYALLERYALHGLLELCEATIAGATASPPSTSTSTTSASVTIATVEEIQQSTLMLQSIGGAGMPVDLDRMRMPVDLDRMRIPRHMQEQEQVREVKGLAQNQRQSKQSSHKTPYLAHRFAVLCQLHPLVPSHALVNMNTGRGEEYLLLRLDTSVSTSTAASISTQNESDEIAKHSSSSLSLCAHILDLLQQYALLEGQHAHAVKSCKERDNKRGDDTIPHYASINKSMMKASLSHAIGGVVGDEVVQQAFFHMKQVQERVNAVLQSKTLLCCGCDEGTSDE